MAVLDFSVATLHFLVFASFHHFINTSTCAPIDGPAECRRSCQQIDIQRIWIRGCLPPNRPCVTSFSDALVHWRLLTWWTHSEGDHLAQSVATHVGDALGTPKSKARTESFWETYAAKTISVWHHAGNLEISRNYSWQCMGGVCLGGARRLRVGGGIMIILLNIEIMITKQLFHWVQNYVFNYKKYMVEPERATRK